MSELPKQPPLEPQENQEIRPVQEERLGAISGRTRDQVEHDAIFVVRNGVSIRVLRALEERAKERANAKVQPDPDIPPIEPDV